MTAAIEIKGLTKRFGAITAVDNLTLQVPEGSIFGFLGANGAGKTTTLRMVAGLARPTSGAITVASVDSREGIPFRRRIGYLSQEPAFYSWMSGREVLEYAARFHEIDGPTGPEIDRLLALVGLTDAARRRCAEYSGGMRQRLGIAAALIGKPAVLLLDEPATGLDPLGRRDVLDLMEQLRSSTTIFYSTHILDDVQRVSDRVAVIDAGRLVVTDRTERLLSRYTSNRLRVALVGATPEIAPRLASIPGVEAVSVDNPSGSGELAFLLDTREGSAPAIQRAITEIASSSGMAVVEARPESLGLEDVFLRLVGKQEKAA